MHKSEPLGKHLRLVDVRNKKMVTEKVLGISLDKYFMPSVANVIGTDLSTYKLISKGLFACNPMHVGRDERLPVALYSIDNPAIVSPAYFMFDVVDDTVLNREYLMMWLRRPEFDRQCWLRTDASVRGGITWEDICRVEIPIIPFDEQTRIVNCYGVLDERIQLLRRLNDNLSDMASTLFQKVFIASHDRNQWPMGTFSHFIKSTVGGDWGQESPIGNYTQEVSCIRGTDIPQLNAGSILSAPTRYILPKNFLTKHIKANDLVIEISGGSPVQATGRVALVPQQVIDYRGDRLICSNFCRVVTVDAIYLQYFLQYWLYLYKAGRMFDYENSSTGLKNFDFSSFVQKEPIPIPPEDVVQEYNRLVGPLYRHLFSTGFEIEALQDAQQHILPHIMLHGF